MNIDKVKIHNIYGHIDRSGRLSLIALLGVILYSEVWYSTKNWVLVMFALAALGLTLPKEYKKVRLTYLGLAILATAIFLAAHLKA